MKDWTWVSLRHATFVLGSVDGVVTEAPPISRRSQGRRLEDVLSYYRGRGATIVELPPTDAMRSAT